MAFFEKLFGGGHEDTAKKESEQALTDAVTAEMNGEWDKAAELYKKGGRPELIERVRQSQNNPDAVATRSAAEVEKYQKAKETPFPDPKNNLP